jgi:hypothetical protein
MEGQIGGGNLANDPNLLAMPLELVIEEEIVRQPINDRWQTVEHELRQGGGVVDSTHPDGKFHSIHSSLGQLQHPMRKEMTGSEASCYKSCPLIVVGLAVTVDLNTLPPVALEVEELFLDKIAFGGVLKEGSGLHLVDSVLLKHSSQRIELVIKGMVGGDALGDMVNPVFV